MARPPVLPTVLHQRAADAIVAFFHTQPHVDAVLLVNSCARGTATPESDLDVAVRVAPALTAADRTALDVQGRPAGTRSRRHDAWSTDQL